MAHTGKAPHEQAMAGYEVACKYGVFEARAFALADDMYAAMFAEDASRQASLARKDALLRMAMEALDKASTFGDRHQGAWCECRVAIAAIEAELSQSPAPVSVQSDMAQPVTLRERIDELVAQHGTLRATARVLMTDCGYLHRLRSGEKTEPGDDLIRRMGLREFSGYVRIAPRKD